MPGSDERRWLDALSRVRALAVTHRDTDRDTDRDTSRDERQRVLAALLGEVARLYTAEAPDPYGDTARAAIAVSPTEACTAAAALLAAQSITPFEFSIWYGGGRVTSRRPDNGVREEPG